MNERPDFFVAGGTLRLQAKSYVTRPADLELLEQARAGEFCYVLTPRQMGKSSLMVRTAQHLREDGQRVVVIDLTGIGGKGVSAEAWYRSLLACIVRDLRLAVDLESWWTERQSISLVQRFIEFLHSVILTQIGRPLTIFVDEIDTTLNLEFRDDFFAAIRYIYNERANDPIYKNLTFVLLGVATPTGLIKSPERTPFNVGRYIELPEFSRDDAQVLARGLDQYYPDQGEAVLDRIFYWTNGHPYLTQKLCQAVAGVSVTAWDEARVDALVETNFFSDEAQNDANLRFVHHAIQDQPESERLRILKLYQKLYRGQMVRNDERSLVQNQLVLFGLVRRCADRLQVRNEIYRHVFDQTWIKENMPTNWQQWRAILTILVALLLIVFIIGLVMMHQIPPNMQAQLCQENFTQAASPAVQIDSLACLFDLGSGYDEDARKRFYSLSPTEQKYLFLLDDPQAVGPQLVSVVKGLYVSLDQIEGNHDQDILEAMLRALEDSGQSEAETLIEEIRYWKQARALAAQHEYEQALDAYQEAINHNSNDSHPVVHYDRALIYIELEQYDHALTDLERTIIIAELAPLTLTPTPTQPTPTPTASNTFTPTPSEVPVGVDTPIHTALPMPPPVTSPTTGITLTATSIPTLEPTPRPDITLSLRFINSDRVIETVRETILQNPDLRNYLVVNQGQYPELRRMFTPPLLPGRIAFPVDNGGGQYDVWILDLASRQSSQVIRFARQPSFSKTGWLIVNGDTYNEKGYNLLLVSPELKVLDIISESPADEYPFWEPTGNRVVYSNATLLDGNPHVFIQCSIAKRLQYEQQLECQDIITFGTMLDDDDHLLVGDAPVWTDTDFIAFRRRFAGRWDGINLLPSWSALRYEDGQEPSLLVPSSQAIPSDAYGNFLYFFALDLNGNPGWEVYSINLATREVVNLSDDASSIDGLPTVSPDGTWVAFVSNRDGRWGIWAVPAAGGTPQKLIDFPNANPWGGAGREWLTERISWGPN